MPRTRPARLTTSCAASPASCTYVRTRCRLRGMQPTASLEGSGAALPADRSRQDWAPFKKHVQGGHGDTGPAFSGVNLTSASCLLTECFVAAAAAADACCHGLQACKRSLEHAQDENFTMHKELVSLRLLAQAAESAEGAVPAGASLSASPAAAAAAGAASSADYAAGPVTTPLAASLPGLRSGGGRASMLPGLTQALSASGALSSSGASSPTAMLSLSGGPAGALQGAGSVVPYGVGRLSALPSGVTAPAAGAANPYAAAAGSKPPARGQGAGP